MFSYQNESPWLSYTVFLKSLINSFSGKNKKFPSRSVLFQVFVYWIQANKESLNQKRHNKMDIFYRQPSLMSYFITSFDSSLSQKGQNRRLDEKQINGVQHKYEKKTEESPYGGWTPCSSETKLENVATLLQGDSVNWVANLTEPICT